jgi:hypothetical protein
MPTSRARAQILVLISLPVVIGTLAGIAYDPVFMWKLLEFVKWILIIFLVWKVGNWFVDLDSRVSHRSQEPELLNKLDTPLENGYMERVDRSSAILHADGYSFEMKNIGGRLHWREIDPSSRTPLETWVSAHPKHAALKGEKTVAADHIRMRVNRRKGYG